MQLLPVAQVINHTLDTSGPTVLEFAFADSSLNTTLQMLDGQLLRLKSNFLPAWSVSLADAGVSPQAVTEANLHGGGLDGGLAYLLERGHLDEPELQALARERALTALVPIVGRSGIVQVHAGGNASAFLAGSDGLQVLQKAERLVHVMGEAERALQPSQRFEVSPTASLPAGSGGHAERVYRAAMRGLTLAELSQRLPMRWDRLTREVTALTETGALRAQDARGPRQVRPRLQAGDTAPDFCLPAMNGSDLRLSDLRGQPVWLVFNRQSTCALCNPHNAQLIALHGRLRALGVSVVTVWGSTVEDLRDGVGRLVPPYPVLADPNDETYDAYGLHFSWAGTLDPRNLPTLLQGVRMMGAKALKSDGEFTRMPAEFLINPDGTVHRAHYNAYGSDWLPVEDVLAWEDALRRA
ncbi:peroxiredoxin-like family protein [Deinococcus aquiradiocola]|nr:peroxiredoxin-like family protein [Deinococcus aquiradiocola]